MTQSKQQDVKLVAILVAGLPSEVAEAGSFPQDPAAVQGESSFLPGTLGTAVGLGGAAALGVFAAASTASSVVSGAAPPAIRQMKGPIQEELRQVFFRHFEKKLKAKLTRAEKTICEFYKKKVK